MTTVKLPLELRWSPGGISSAMRSSYVATALVACKSTFLTGKSKEERDEENALESSGS